MMQRYRSLGSAGEDQQDGGSLEEMAGGDDGDQGKHQLPGQPPPHPLPSRPSEHLALNFSSPPLKERNDSFHLTMGRRAQFRAKVYVRVCNMQIRSYKCKMCKDSQIRLYLLLVLVITRKKGVRPTRFRARSLSYLTRM